MLISTVASGATNGVKVDATAETKTGVTVAQRLALKVLIGGSYWLAHFISLLEQSCLSSRCLRRCRLLCVAPVSLFAHRVYKSAFQKARRSLTWVQVTNVNGD